MIENDKKPSKQPKRPKRVSSTMQPKFVKGKLVFEKKIRAYEFDLILQKWVKISETTKLLEPSEVGLKKEIEFDTLLLREGTSDVDLRRIRRWFLLHVKIKIPRVKSTRFAYLKLLEPDKVFIENFRPHYCYQIGLADRNDCYDVIIKKKVKISEKRAKELISKGYSVRKEVAHGFGLPV